MSDAPTLYLWDDSEFDGINLPIESVGKGAYATFHDALVGIGVLVPVKPPNLDVLAGFLSTIDIQPSQHHPDTMRPIAAELLRLAGWEVTDE